MKIGAFAVNESRWPYYQVEYGRARRRNTRERGKACLNLIRGSLPHG